MRYAYLKSYKTNFIRSKSNTTFIVFCLFTPMCFIDFTFIISFTMIYTFYIHRQIPNKDKIKGFYDIVFFWYVTTLYKTNQVEK